jgi:hypothetical protein
MSIVLQIIFTKCRKQKHNVVTVSDLSFHSEAILQISMKFCVSFIYTKTYKENLNLGLVQKNKSQILVDKIPQKRFVLK